MRHAAKTLAALLSLSACAAVGRDAAPGQLTTDALRALLSDVYVTAALPAGTVVSSPDGEVFEANGNYVRAGNRSRRSGTFRIENNVVCVTGNEISRRCRKAFHRSDGTYLLVDIDNGSTSIVTIIAG